MRGFMNWLIVAQLLGACSAIDPKVGATQAECGAKGTEGEEENSSDGSYTSMVTPAGQAPICPVDVNDACNACEAEHCCVSRTNCYGDPVCACADEALDGCLEKAESAPNDSPTPEDCWNAFSAVGKVERSRQSCLNAYCRGACALP